MWLYPCSAVLAAKSLKHRTIQDFALDLALPLLEAGASNAALSFTFTDITGITLTIFDLIASAYIANETVLLTFGVCPVRSQCGCTNKRTQNEWKIAVGTSFDTETRKYNDSKLQHDSTTPVHGCGMVCCCWTQNEISVIILILSLSLFIVQRCSAGARQKMFTFKLRDTIVQDNSNMLFCSISLRGVLDLREISAQLSTEWINSLLGMEHIY